MKEGVYKILSGEIPEALEALVNSYLRDGWLLRGDIVLTNGRGMNRVYSQVMVRNKEVLPKNP